jgi:hypothetical protein
MNACASSAVTILALTLSAVPRPAPSAEASNLPDPFQPAHRLTARTWNSGFPDAHDTYNGMGTGSDGKIYYVLSSERYDVGAQVFAFDPKTQRVQRLGDLTEACGEKGKKTIVQGKSHVNFIEADGKLYFSTHIGYYSIIDGMEKMGLPPAGWKPYPGGHLLAYDLKSGKFDDLAIAPEREGVLAMNMDTERGRIFGLTWPSGMFFRFDVAKKDMKNFGKACAEGENGKDAAYRTICRSIAVNPADGSAWFTTSEGTILRYRADTDAVEPVAGEDLKKDYFGLYDATSPGHMGYNWRQTFWRPDDQAVYGVHGNSGYLFRFDPKGPRVQVLDRLTSMPSKASGMFDQFSYGYLGFAPGPDGRTIYYLTGGPIYRDGRRVRGKDSTAMGEAKGLEDLHLITYDIPAAKCTDHGAIFYENGDRPLYVNSIAVGLDGAVHFLARITEGGTTRTDLCRVERPTPRTAATPELRPRDPGAPGSLSVDVKGLPFGAYDAAFTAAVQQRWQVLLDHAQIQPRQGKVVLGFRLDPDGKVHDLQMATSDVGALQSLLCQRAVLDPAPYAKWPAEMRRTIDANGRDVRLTFNYP